MNCIDVRDLVSVVGHVYEGYRQFESVIQAVQTIQTRRKNLPPHASWKDKICITVGPVLQAGAGVANYIRRRHTTLSLEDKWKWEAVAAVANGVRGSYMLVEDLYQRDQVKIILDGIDVMLMIYHFRNRQQHYRLEAQWCHIKEEDDPPLKKALERDIAQLDQDWLSAKRIRDAAPFLVPFVEKAPLSQVKSSQPICSSLSFEEKREVVEDVAQEDHHVSLASEAFGNINCPLTGRLIHEPKTILVREQGRIVKRNFEASAIKKYIKSCKMAHKPLTIPGEETVFNERAFIENPELKTALRGSWEKVQKNKNRNNRKTSLIFTRMDS